MESQSPQITSSTANTQIAAWPPNYLAETNRRIKMYNRVFQKPELHKEIARFYRQRENCIQWINDWCVTLDPRAKPPKPKMMPFILFPRQCEFVDFILGCYFDKEAGLVEKSRDMGATWLSCAISVWLWLYHPGTIIGWGSRLKEYVDHTEDPKAVFPKIRQIIRSLPTFMRPDGFKPTIHMPYMRIINPETGSTIIGEGGDNMGRGGRSSIYFKDESAHYEHPELIEAALGDNTDVQIDMSSVNLPGNVFHRRRLAGEIWEPGKIMPKNRTRVFIMDWRHHPEKTQDWYDARKSKAISEGLVAEFAREVDRDYAASNDKIIIKSEWVRAAIDAHVKLNIAADGLKAAGQDVADGGIDKNALVMVTGVIVNHCEHWHGEAGDAARKAIPICIEHGMQELYYDSPGVGSGFKDASNQLLKAHRATHEHHPNYRPIRVYPWNGGSEVVNPDSHLIPFDTQSPTNKDHFYNLKAQAWWNLRTRFYKTYRMVNGLESYPHEELISLHSGMPLLSQLCMELSQAVYDENGKGKLVVDKKPDGSLSPNLADALVIRMTPKREVSILDVL